MHGHLPAKELYAAAQLLYAIDAVFNADPSVEADAGQFGEDGVVVIEALADFTVAEPPGVAEGVFFLLQVLDRPLGQVSVAGVHGDDAALHPPEQFQRVFAGQDGVARVVVDAEVGMVDACHQVAETSIFWANSGCSQ